MNSVFAKTLITLTSSIYTEYLIDNLYLSEVESKSHRAPIPKISVS